MCEQTEQTDESFQSERIWSISPLTDSPTSVSDLVRATDKVDITEMIYGLFYTLLTCPSVQQLSVFEKQAEESFQSENIWFTRACNEEKESHSQGNLSSNKINNTSTEARDHFIGKSVLHSTHTTRVFCSVFLFAH